MTRNGKVERDLHYIVVVYNIISLLVLKVLRLRKVVPASPMTAAAAARSHNHYDFFTSDCYRSLWCRQRERKIL